MGPALVSLLIAAAPVGGPAPPTGSGDPSDVRTAFGLLAGLAAVGFILVFSLILIQIARRRRLAGGRRATRPARRAIADPWREAGRRARPDDELGAPPPSPGDEP